MAAKMAWACHCQGRPEFSIDYFDIHGFVLYINRSRPKTRPDQAMIITFVHKMMVKTYRYRYRAKIRVIH